MTTKRRRGNGRTPTDVSGAVSDFRYPDKRKNNPPAGLAPQGRISEVPKQHYAYDPHLPPILRFDATGKEDRLPELLEKARERALTGEEVKTLNEALRNRQPWLEWAGKREKRGFEVDPVALHVHERVSAQAILRIAGRQEVQRTLWGDPEQEYHEALKFYQYDVAWANRLILGDSLVVMNSLAKREDLAGKVQMIYMDPPYGIKFASNFQPTIGNRDVRDREQDLTREPEMVKAYRDTWTLGVHSYLAYLRDRLLVARELLADSGSIFVQIGDENLHRVRALFDEVFNPRNHITTIVYRTAIGMTSDLLDGVYDHIIWFAKDIEKVKYKQLFSQLEVGQEGATRYKQVESPITGETRLTSDDERSNPEMISKEWRPYRDQGLTSRSGSATTIFPVVFHGESFRPSSGGWRTNIQGLGRVAKAERILHTGNTISYKKFFDDSPVLALTNFWNDTGGGITSRSDPKIFAVQTSPTITERCLLMTTEPGDLVLDPTCGSGTTAYVAEQWGRRWITVDTSRVAIALARQRLLTATFDQFKTRDGGTTVRRDSFIYKTVPHIELGKSIAQNASLDPIFATWEPVVKDKLAALNAALRGVPQEVRSRLQAKLAQKERKEGKRAVTDADRRRWLLPKTEWREWEAPFDTDPDWPKPLQVALTDYRDAWRAKMKAINECIAAGAEQEELVDQPELEGRMVRVCGPFTVEAVQPAEDSLDGDSPIGGEPEEMETFDPAQAVDAPANAEAYLDKMLRLLRTTGVLFPDKKVMTFTQLVPLSGTNTILHGEGEWVNGEANKPRRVAVSIGPQYGPVTAMQVEDAVRAANRRGYDDLVFAGFSFDGAAQAAIQESPHKNLRVHMALISPDVNMGGLLKDTHSSQLFTVFGAPRTKVERGDSGEWTVTMEGVDIYNPIENTIQSASADKVAAWFVDSDYDGRTFCICQAFFPDKSAWSKLANALKGVIDEETFAAFSRTESLPFPVGKHKRVAVKVINPRGNEVMRVHSLDGKTTYE